MKIGIVIPVMNLWNRYTKQCIDSIKTKHEYRVIIVDNASSDDTRREASQLMHSHSNFFYKRNEKNYGCGWAWNFGIKNAFESGCDFALVINNDILMHPDMIDKLIGRFEKGLSDVVMVTAMDIRGECENSTDVFTKSWNKDNVEEAEHPNFSAFMINRRCYDEVGEIDEGFAPAYFEDNDYHYRIKLAGLKAIVYPPALFYHFGSRTQNENMIFPIVNASRFEINKKYFFDKWGGLPGDEKYRNPFNDPAKTHKWVTKSVVNR